MATIIAQNEFGSYAIPESVAYRPAARATLKGKVWERSTIMFMRQHASDGDVLQAGAFFGDFLPAISQCLAASARVWAFEPNLENFEHAKQTIELNALDNVVLQNMGLGERRAIRKLRVANRQGIALGGASRFVDYDDAVAGERLIDAPVGCIDDLIPPDRNISIVQLDLEGYELRALRGGMQTIKRCMPIVIVEINEPASKCAELLKAAGYSVRGTLGKNLVVVPARLGDSIAL